MLSFESHILLLILRFFLEILSSETSIFHHHLGNMICDMYFILFQPAQANLSVFVHVFKIIQILYNTYPSWVW